MFFVGMAMRKFRFRAPGFDLRALVRLPRPCLEFGGAKAKNRNSAMGMTSRKVGLHGGNVQGQLSRADWACLEVRYVLSNWLA